VNINFIQGIISYPVTGNLQSFMKKTGSYVSFIADNGNTDIALAHGDTNYLLSESVNTPNAWGPLQSNVDYWLYWDINTTTGERSYGFTELEPLYSASRPFTASDDQHWFDTVGKKMYVRQQSAWREVIRTFAAKVNTSTFFPLGMGFNLRPYAGSQVELFHPDTLVGRIIVDAVGRPIRRENGTFFTTEDDFFVEGSPINTIRLESSILTATATQNIARHQVVKFSDFDKVTPAGYNDTETTAIAIAMEDAIQNATITLCVQGRIENPLWTWAQVGLPLWIGTGGDLVLTDPHLIDPIAYPEAKVPVGRVLSPTSIIFDQGLGARGQQGEPGNATSLIATNIIAGISRLSVPAVIPYDPVVVGDNDPRNSDARTPLPHVQDAVTINAPAHGSLLYGTLDTQLAQLEDRKLEIAGGEMTGPLILSGDPTLAEQAATKNYVDQQIAAIPEPAQALDDLTDVTITSPVTDNVLTYNGTLWINRPLPTIDLDSLTDVTVALPSVGQVLAFDGTRWVNTTLPPPHSTLASLTDVTLTNPVNGQTLTYNGTRWVNAAGSGLTRVTSNGTGETLVSDDGAADKIAKLKSLTSGGTIAFTHTVDELSIDLAPGAGGISDAPNDGFAYGRMDLQWVRVPVATNVVNTVNNLTNNVTIRSGGAGLTVATVGGEIVVTNTASSTVNSVNGKTGTVVLSASDVGAVRRLITTGSGLTLINDGGQIDSDAKLKSLVAGPSISLTETATEITVGLTSGGAGIPEAPSDGTTYGRRNAQWTAVPELTDVVTSVNSLKNAVTIRNGSGINVSTIAGEVVISNTAPGGVTDVNGKVGSVTIAGGPNTVVNSSGSSITISAPGLVGEAPINANSYMRQNGLWVIANPIQTVTDAVGSGQSLIASVSLGTATFKRIAAGSNVTITPSGNDLVIASTGGSGNVENAGTGEIGLVVASPPPGVTQIKTLHAGTNIALVESDNTITIAATGSAGAGVLTVNGIAPNPLTGDVLLSANDVGALSSSGGTVNGVIDMLNNKITGVATATNPSDAVNLQTMQNAIFDSGIYA